MDWNDLWQQAEECCWQDESGLRGHGARIAYVRSTQEASMAIRYANQNGIPLTIQGSRTGLKGGAVPAGGYGISTSKMKDILAFCYDPEHQTGQIRVQAGLTLGELEALLCDKTLDTSRLDCDSQLAWKRYCNAPSRLIFPPNPTEASASLGGVAACNGTGSRTRTGGGVGRFLSGLTIILADGTRLDYERGDDLPPVFQPCLRPPQCPLEADYLQAGYHTGGDLIDLFCGSEGTLGLITELTLDLSADRGIRQGVMIPFAGIAQLERCWRNLETDRSNLPLSDAFCFHEGCFRFFRTLSPEPRLQPEFLCESGLLYLELYARDEEEILDALERILLAVQEAGIQDDGVTIASSDRQLTAVSQFRHKLIEAAHQSILAPPYSAELQVSREAFFSALDNLGQVLDGVGGHGILWGNCLTSQINLVVDRDALRVRDPNGQWIAEQEDRWRGLGYRCSGEYGVGRLKTAQFARLSPERWEETLRIRRQVTGAFLLNPWVLTPAEEQPHMSL